MVRTTLPLTGTQSMCRERQTLDFVQSQIHPTVFLHRRGETLEGMRGVHVDDDLMAGSIGSKNYNRNEFGKRFVDGHGPQTSAHRGREAHTWSRPIGDHRSGENRSEFVHDRRIHGSSPADDKRAALHVQIPRDLQRSSRMHVRWVATAQMIADALAKEVESFALDHVLQTPQININEHRTLHGSLPETYGRKRKHAPSTLSTTGGLTKRPTQRSCHRARSVISLIAPA